MASEYITLGKIGAPHGVKGWVRITSYTEVLDQIFDFKTWLVGKERRTMTVVEHRRRGDKLVAKLEGCDDRNIAQQLTNQEIVTPREQLPELTDGQYYWSDLEGLTVTTTTGVVLGQVDEVFTTGSNDVLVVEGDRRRLIPFIKEEVIIQVNLSEKSLLVDWDPEF